MRPGIKRVIKIAALIVLLSLVLLLSFGYLQYRELRKTLAIKISAKATVFIGQEVEIEDVSISPTAGINLYNIRIKNPEGFTPGDLLNIKRIFLGMNYARLANGVFSFDDITVYSPALTVQRDKEGRMNISEKLKDFFKRKSTLNYDIKDFQIRSGFIDFNQKHSLRSDALNIHLKGLSSEAGHKTLIQGDTIYAADNKITVDGWAYLKDDAKKFSVVISSKDPGLSLLKEFFDRFGIAAEKMKVTVRVNAEGDTDQGIRLASEIGMKESGFTFFKREGKDILLTMRAFLNIRENFLSVEDVSLNAGASTAATAKGDIKKVQEDFVYTAWLNIRRLDLSEFNFMQNAQVKGILTSDNMRIRGSLKKPLADLSGVVQLRDGGFKSNTEDIDGVSAQVKLSPEKGMTIVAGMRAKIVKVYGYLLSKPADAVLSLTAHGSPENVTVISSANVSPVGIRLKDDNKISLKSISLAVDGRIKNKTMEMKNRIEISGLTYDTYEAPWLRSSSVVTYQGNVITMKKQDIEGKDFKVAAEGITVRLPAKKRADTVTMEIKDLSASYPQKKAELKKAALSLRVGTGPQRAGDVTFSLAEGAFYGIRTGFIKGSGRFDSNAFSLNVSEASIASGNAEFSVKGKVSGGPFPLTIISKARNIDIGNLSGEALKMTGMPYALSGNCKSFIFEGTIDSQETVHGIAEVQAEKIAVIRNDKKNIVQGASLQGGMTFRGNDLEFNANAAAGKISMRVSGAAKRFLHQDRSAEVKIIQPQVMVTDLREMFWDVFPDSLLYAGLDGSLSADVLIQYGGGEMKVNGDLDLKDLSLSGENGEYAIGPVNGVIPIVYSKKTIPASPSVSQRKEVPDEKQEMRLPVLGRSEFENMSRMYSREFAGEGYRKITIGSVSYGFRFVDDMSIWMKQDGDFLNIGRFSGSIFGGRLNGSAIADFSEGLHYRAGIHLEGLSLTNLCNSIEPIKGYISGKVNGIATLKGSGPGISQLIGKAEFWSYATRDEKTKISKEFLKKMGGPSLKAYLGDRHFDTGIMNLYLQNGFMIFEELEISNRNIIGMRDLSIKVAPFNNRIAVDHLMWSITEAASRAKEKK
jgi:hypothetical protein